MSKTALNYAKSFGLIAIPAALLVGVGGCSSGGEGSQDNEFTFLGEKVQSLQGSESKPEPVGVTRSGDGSGPDVADGSVEKAGCWVTLDYCRDPNHSGVPSCHQNGGCTLARTVSVCADLIGDYGCAANGSYITFYVSGSGYWYGPVY